MRSSLGKDFNVEICANCHPVYSGGKSRLIDTAGNIEKFNRRFRKPAPAAAG
jgi:large subunit ribosomal protein L31